MSTDRERNLARRVAGLESILADRERELLTVKGPCSVTGCRLHYAHSGPCDIWEADDEWPMPATLDRCRDEIRDLRRRIWRTFDALPEWVDSENEVPDTLPNLIEELDTCIRTVVAALAETRAVVAEEIARSLEGELTAGARPPWDVPDGRLTARDVREWAARIAREHAREQ